jgi:heat-inducible transcriptional repressor
MEKLLRDATRMLASETRTLSLAATDEGDIYTAGMGHILDMPEFYDIDITRHLLETLDEYNYWWDLLQRLNTEEALGILLGEELDHKNLAQCGGVFVTFKSPTHSGAIGVIGPTRLNYSRIIPVVKYLGGLINDFSREW